MKTKMRLSVKLIIAGAAVVAVAAIAFVIIMLNRKTEESYRSIRVYEIEGGTAEVDRESTGLIDAYADMMLQTNDKVHTLTDCYMQLQMDENKYVMVNPETRFTLTAEGNADDSKTVINLDEGSIINQINDKLSDDSEYVVKTASSTMAVRGTCFRVYVYKDANGESHTVLEVFEGIVECHLVYPDGSIDDEAVMVYPGTKIGIRGNQVTSEYEYTDGTVDYSEFDEQSIEFLRFCVEDLSDDFRIVWTVTFECDGNTFGTQTVTDGECAQEPSLMPAASGHWDFDFDTEINGDTVINWVY